MGILDRIRDTVTTVYDDVAADFNAHHARRGSPIRVPRAQTTMPYSYGSPNAQPEVTPASMPQSASMSGVSQPFPGGAQFLSVTLDGSGNGQVQIGPQRVREHWQITGVGVSVATQVKQASCSIYVGNSISPATFVGSTALGSSGATCAVAGMDIQPGQSVFAVWEGGDAGQQATAAVFGTYTIGAPQ